MTARNSSGQFVKGPRRASNSSFKLTGNLQRNLELMPGKQRAAIAAAAHYTAPQAEAYMRENATWVDRTGAARNGLRARVYSEGDTIAIVLYHTVSYGVFLEIRWGGKYAIIMKAVQANKPIFIKAVKSLIWRM